MQHGRTFALLGALPAALLLLAASAAAAPSAAERCRMIKLQSTGMHALAHLRCHARAIAQGSPVQLSCLAVADNRLAKAFARAERKAACPPTLESAKAQSEAFVAALVASAEPTPAPTASPTPTPVPTPSPTPGCGNGIVDPGEQCDGQSFCGPSCVVPLPTVCCGQSGFCLQGEFPELADVCGGQGIPYVLGGLCESTEPSCEPTAGCPGECVPEATFATTSLCCELVSGCVDTEVGDTISLWGFAVQSCLFSGGSFFSVGVCGPSGQCAP